MKLTEDRSPVKYIITSYSPGVLSINRSDYAAGIIVTPDALHADWAVSHPENIDAATVTRLLAMQPELVIIGTGPRLVFPPSETRALFAAHGIGCEVMDSGAACRTFNLLIGEGRRVVAAILPP
ncbi:MAG: Mth938-like domain-containing protein [Thiotrichales bacterium]